MASNRNVTVAAFFRACLNHAVVARRFVLDKGQEGPGFCDGSEALCIHCELTTIQLCSRLSQARRFKGKARTKLAERKLLNFQRRPTEGRKRRS